MNIILTQTAELSAIRQVLALSTASGELLYSKYVALNANEMESIMRVQELAEVKLSEITHACLNVGNIPETALDDFEILCQKDLFIRATLGNGIVKNDQILQLASKLDGDSMVEKTVLLAIQEATNRQCGFAII